MREKQRKSETEIDKHLQSKIRLCFHFHEIRCFGPHREQQLNALLRLYEENEDAMCEALLKDLHKCRQEAIINEVELLRNDVRNLIMNLRSYAAIEYVSVFPHFWFSMQIPFSWSQNMNENVY